MGDFWAWAYSDILCNRNRGIFAEFLAGAALGVIQEPRIEWDGHDLLYQNKKIEVKTAGFWMSWPQEAPSDIRFDIAPKKAWDAASNTLAKQGERASDCYVFCFHAELDRNQVNVLNISQWEFYVISTSELDQLFGKQKSLGLNPLRKLRSPVRYDELRKVIDTALGK